MQAVQEPMDEDFITRFSRLNILLKTIARCLRWKHLLRLEGRESIKRSLTATELSRAYLECIRYVQWKSFKDEI